MSSLLALMLATGMTFFHPVTQYDLTEEEWCIARVVYFEAASSRNPEPYIELQTIAYVVHARKRDNRRKWGGDTACGVALKNARGTWQFSSMAKAVNRSSEPSGWRWDDSVSATLTVTRYGWEPDGDWRYVRYYMRRLYSAPKNVARFDAEFKKIGELGHHEFYAPVETLFDELSRLILGKPKEKEWFARCERQSPDSHDSVDKPEGRIDRIHKHHRR